MVANTRFLTMKDKTYPYDQALAIAQDILEQLRPYCERIQIAGSLRRECPQVGDIELVVIPKPYETGLFENGLAAVVNQWPKVKGEMEYGVTKYTQRILPTGIKLDLFFAEPGNWGSILAIRTGSTEFSHRVLAVGWTKLGYESRGGYLWRDGRMREVREERDLFNIINIPYTEPKNRNL